MMGYLFRIIWDSTKIIFDKMQHLTLIDPFLMGILDQVVAVSGLLDQNCDDDLVANSGPRPFWKYLKC